MGRNNNAKFLDICPECGTAMTLTAQGKQIEMYCGECGYFEDPRVRFQSKEDPRRKFRRQKEVPLG